MTLAKGAKLGPYEILAPIGAGGMGEVYRAKDLRLARDVAIKLLPEEFFEDEERRLRFGREARTLASLNHPGIAAIYSFEEIPGLSSASRHLLVMELVEGEDLGQRVASGPLPPEEALSLARQIAEALEAAHEKGIVHRDLKPANVKVTPGVRVKLLDFGLAKIFEGERDSSKGGSGASVSESPTITARATAAGIILGTAAYMSPEQARGKPVDKRTDIWAFGCVLYEMLTGKRAFEGETVSDTLAAILKEDPNWAALPIGTPEKVREVLRKCLRRDSKQRLHDIADARLDLEELSTASALSSSGQLPFEDRTAAPSPTVGRSDAMRVERGSKNLLSLYLPWVVAGAFAAAAAVFGVLALRARAPQAPTGVAARFQIGAPGGGTFTGMLALSPDGSRLAAVATGADGRDRIFLRPLDALEMQPVAGTEGAAYPFFSPDGQHIAFFASGTLRSIDLEKGSVHTICKARNARGGVWGPDGSILFAPNVGGEIDRVPAGGGEPVRLAALSPKVTSLRWPTLLPDGRHFLVLSFGNEGNPQLAAGSIGSTTTVPVAPAESGAFFARNFLYFLREGRLVRAPFDPVVLKITGAAEPVAEDVYWDLYASGYAGFTVSQTGAMAWLAGGISLSRLVWHDRSGKVLGTVGPPGPYFEPDLSPDEKTLAFSRADPETGAGGIWLLDLLRGSFSRISFQANSVTPLWRADGKSVAYSTFPRGKVFLRDAGASSNAEPLFENGTFCILEDWAPDGRIFFSSVEDMATFRERILVRPADGGAPQPVLSGPFSVQQARLSPDGSWLAYVSDESGVDEVLVRSYPKGAERFAISAGGGTQPRWRGDGKELFYVTPDSKIMSVPIATRPRFDPGAPAVLFQTRILPLVEARNHYVATRDGQRFLVNSRREEAASFPVVVVTPRGSGERR